MRPFTPLIAAGLALAASQALAASPTTAGSANMPATDAPMQSTQPSPPASTAMKPPATPAAPATTTTPSTSAPGSQSATAGSASGSAADTSATAGASAAAPAALAVGEPVKDNTGATIGAISGLNNGANGQKMAVIKMGNDTFQVPSDKLGADSGSATINMSQAQIAGMLHPPAGGK